MTLLMLWTNKEADATAINIAADSRLSNETVSWDYATKIHRLLPTSTWMAYCGDSFNALSAIAFGIAATSNTDHLQQAASGGGPTVQARVQAICAHLQLMFSRMPRDWQGKASLLFLDYDHRKGRFSAWEVVVDGTSVEAPREIELRAKRIHCFGSGAKEAENALERLRPTGAFNTPGFVRVLCGEIRGPDRTVGGSPQMVMLQKDSSRPVGFYWPCSGKERRHLFGVPIEFESKMEGVMWVTPEFEERPYKPFRRSET